ncbi:chemokine-like factor isoform X2 [Microcebus murinus]|uniref:chemokine-like factor isoform X2 n=1 Tax=Microcebus murinus TaxID=30608 RepID=UPI00064306F8|nr:CKLF-like MARVEL transmembrane domain-containing protein 2 isoform X2 [Microcebus murinus]
MEPEKQAPVSSVSEAPPAADPKGAVPPQVSIAQPKKAAQSGRPKPSAGLAKDSKPGKIKKSAKDEKSKKRAEEEAIKKRAEEEVKKYAEEEEVKKRAEGRAKVPERFRDSLKRFFFSPTGMLKILRMGFTIGALTCFIISEANDSYIAITVLEVCVVIFFIITYMLTLQHLLIYLDWPLLDLINSIISAVFLVVVAILTVQEKDRRHLFYVGGRQSRVSSIRSWSPSG